jgi:predicted metal-dependent HD superfamily phosphohydrolase
MVRIESRTVEEAKIFVSNILDTQLPKSRVFHTKIHTFDVLGNVELIGKYHNFKEDDLNILRLSALFHDIGYIKKYAGHEEESVTMASDFLMLKKIKKTTIKIITTAILATKVPQSPRDIYSKILCDADLMHLTYDSYFDNKKLMRQEWELSGIISLSEKEFDINSVQFFNSHKYHSEYGKLILQPKKESNLEMIKNKISK